ncbi:phage major capsid protein [Acinetobacter sp. ME22]|uniref:phage major capsid protein n=1 Tax=Acinetobacter sp. ME22 TaxID=2904802 RepID=UPI001ED9DA89|nr:phage major capsid protein [Acinetobacter sp. ME22]MCG2574218.1 phage major capsid protein [Acinetobacter sp. ME22]
MTLQEHIDKIKATIQDTQKKISGVMEKSLKEGKTPEGDDEATIKGYEAEIENLQLNLKRLENIQKGQVEWGASTTPVAGQTPEQGTQSTQGNPIKVESNLPKGIGFAMMVKASAMAAHSKGQVTAIDILKGWNAPEIVQKALTQKALIGSTTNSSFGESLVDYSNLTAEFIELLRGKTVVDKIATRMRQVPFNIKMPSQTGAASVGWVGETKTKGVTNPTTGSLTLSKSKIAGIVLLSDELVRFSSPKADAIVRDDLVKSTAEFMDDQFLDPSKAESDDSPASVLYGTTPVTSTGTTAAAYEADLLSLIKLLTDNNIPLDGATWVMSETRAATLSVMRDALGKKYFEEMNINGDKYLLTLPVEISAKATDKIALVVPGEILLADDEFMDFAVSTEATINLGTDAAPNWVNLYQNNLMAIRGERYIRWKPRRSYAAGYIQYS